MKNNKGFTYIEMLFALGVMAIILLMSMSRSVKHKSRLETAIKITRSTFKSARDQAGSLNQRVLVTLSQSNNKVTFQKSNIDQSTIYNTVTLSTAASLSTVPNVDQIIFSPTSAIQAKLNTVSVVPTQNIVLTYTDSFNVTKQLTLFYHTGSTYSVNP